MTCTSVIPCLSSGLAKIKNLIAIVGLFSQLFLAILKVWLFSKMGGGGGGGTNLTPKQSDSIFFVNFSKIQQLSNNFSEKLGYFD